MESASRDLADRILSGDEKTAARLISLLEEEREEAYEVLPLLYPAIKKSHIVGITGPPGAGKSSLAGRLAVLFASAHRQVGVVAVDPSSVKHSGALLGDRLRMKGAEELRNVFIRSMANRAHPGGLAKATAGALYVLAALGKDLILVESAGAGQSEKTVSYVADTVITIFTPDSGDEIQMLKAGLLEIGDIVVVNKMDNDGAEATRQLLTACAGRGQETAWSVPVVMCRADEGEGVADVARAIGEHASFLRLEGEARRCRKRVAFAVLLLKEELMARFLRDHEGTPFYERWRDAVGSASLDPYTAVREIVKKTFS